jgi:hypothetical protein
MNGRVVIAETTAGAYKLSLEEASRASLLYAEAACMSATGSEDTGRSRPEVLWLTENPGKLAFLCLMFSQARGWRSAR